MVVRALEKALGDYRRAPYNARYIGRAEARREGYDGDPFYEIEISAEEGRRFWAIVNDLARSDGWSHAPVEYELSDIPSDTKR